MFHEVSLGTPTNWTLERDLPAGCLCIHGTEDSCLESTLKRTG